MKLEIDQALEGLANPQYAALVVRTNLLSITTLSQDLPFADDGEFSMEDHVIFATLIALSTSFLTVVEHDEFVDAKSMELSESYAEISERFERGDLYNDPAAALARQCSDYSAGVSERLSCLEEYCLCAPTSPAHSLAQGSATVAARLGQGLSVRGDAAAAYDAAFQTASGSQFRKTFIADAKRLQSGVGVPEVLSRPLYSDIPDAERYHEEWHQLREKLHTSSIATWGIWINWIEDRLKGEPLDLAQLKKWSSIPLGEYPRASELNPALEAT